MLCCKPCSCERVEKKTETAKETKTKDFIFLLRGNCVEKEIEHLQFFFAFLFFCYTYWLYFIKSIYIRIDKKKSSDRVSDQKKCLYFFFVWLTFYYCPFLLLCHVPRSKLRTLRTFFVYRSQYENMCCALIPYFFLLLDLLVQKRLIFDFTFRLLCAHVALLPFFGLFVHIESIYCRPLW